MRERQIKQLVREVRQCAGVEKTPDQIAGILFSRFKRPQTALNKLLACPDMCQQFAREIALDTSDLPTVYDILDSGSSTNDN